MMSPRAAPRNANEGRHEPRVTPPAPHGQTKKAARLPAFLPGMPEGVPADWDRPGHRAADRTPRELPGRGAAARWFDRVISNRR